MLPLRKTVFILGDGGKLSLPHNIITSLLQTDWNYESTAFLFFMPITPRSLLGLF